MRKKIVARIIVVVFFSDNFISFLIKMDNQTWIERNGFVPRETSRKRPRIDDFSNKIGFRVLVSNQVSSIFTRMMLCNSDRVFGTIS